MPRIHTDIQTHYLLFSIAPQLVFLPSVSLLSVVVTFFLFPPPLVWEKVIAKAKKDDTGRITLSPFFRELLEGVKNTQTEPPSLHSSTVYSSNSWCCASSAGWTSWGKIARSRSQVRFHSSRHTWKQMYQRVKRTPLISHQSLGVAGTELAVVKGIALKLNTVTFPS